MDIVDVSPTRLEHERQRHRAFGDRSNVLDRLHQDGQELYCRLLLQRLDLQRRRRELDAADLAAARSEPVQRARRAGRLVRRRPRRLARMAGGEHPRLLGTLTRSGFADIVGFGACGMWTALGNGDGTFQDPVVVNSDFGLDAGGWQVDKHPRFLADLNKDGLADVVGFGDDGVWTALGNGDGTFQSAGFALNDLGYNQGWRVEKHPRFALDIDDDGFADVIGFGDTYVWSAIGNGVGGFRPRARFTRTTATTRGGGSRSIRALSSTSTRMAAPTSSPSVTRASGPLSRTPTARSRTRTLSPSCPTSACSKAGRSTGTRALSSTSTTTVFPTSSASATTAYGSRSTTAREASDPPEVHPGLVLLRSGLARRPASRDFVIDLDGDGVADIIGFGDAGIWTAIGKGDGTFNSAQYVQANLGVQQGWRVDRHPRFAAKLAPNTVGIVGFGDAGVWSAVGDGHGGFPATNLVKLQFGYGTIVLALVANDRAMNSRGLWRSTDWGNNWVQVHQFNTTINVGELQWAEGSDHLVYAAGGASLAISKDAGATFTDVFPWGRGPAASVNHVAVWQNEAADPFPAVIYALGDRTMFVSFDGGVTWTRDMGAVTAENRRRHEPERQLQRGACHGDLAALPAPCLCHGERERFAGDALSRRLYALSRRRRRRTGRRCRCRNLSSMQTNMDSGNVFLLATQKGQGDLLFFRPATIFLRKRHGQRGRLGRSDRPGSAVRLDSSRLRSRGPARLSPLARLQGQDRGRPVQAGRGTLWMLSDGGIYRSSDGGWNFSPADTAATLSALSVAGVSIAGKGVALSLDSGDNDGFYSMDGGQHWSYQQYGGGDNDCAFADPLRPHAIMVFTPRWDTAANSQFTADGQTVSVYQTQPGNLPDASASGHDRKAVTGPPTVPKAWNASSFYGERGFRPVVLGLLGEDALEQGDYAFVLNPESGQPVVVRTQTIFDIKHRVEWVTTATGPGQGANVFLQGPPLPEAHLGVLQTAGGHLNTVFYVGGANPSSNDPSVGPNTDLWTWAAGASGWTKSCPPRPFRGSRPARRPRSGSSSIRISRRKSTSSTSTPRPAITSSGPRTGA